MRLPDPFALACALDDAYDHVLAQYCSVDFVRAGGLPFVGIDTGGSAWVELESLDWGTRRRVSLSVPELEIMAKPRGHSVRIISDRIERAVAELREAPPFYVEEA